MFIEKLNAKILIILVGKLKKKTPLGTGLRFRNDIIGRNVALKLLQNAIKNIHNYQ